MSATAMPIVDERSGPPGSSARSRSRFVTGKTQMAERQGSVPRRQGRRNTERTCRSDSLLDTPQLLVLRLVVDWVASTEVQAGRAGRGLRCSGYLVRLGGRQQHDVLGVLRRGRNAWVREDPVHLIDGFPADPGQIVTVDRTDVLALVALLHLKRA